MRRLEVVLATQHHGKSGEVLEALREEFGDDDVDVTLIKRILPAEQDMDGVAYSYERADAEEERHLQRIIGTVLGV